MSAKIIKGKDVPSKPSYTKMVRTMAIGDCVECDTPAEVQGFCVAMRTLGYKPIRRKIYRIWLEEGEEE